MQTRQLIPAIAITLSTLATSGSASAGFEFEPVITRIDRPVPHKPVVTPVCTDKRSPEYGWCLPDFVAEFDNINPGLGPDGSGFISLVIGNTGTPSTAPLWSTLTVEQGTLVEISGITAGDAVLEIEQSPYDRHTWIILAPNGIPRDEYRSVGLVFEDAFEIDTTIRTNYHADVEEHGLAGHDGYRLDERRSSNNRSDYRYLWR